MLRLLQSFWAGDPDSQDFQNQGVFHSESPHHKLPQTWWLGTVGMDSLGVLEAGTGQPGSL